LILAIGNSARDTFVMLNDKIEMENKPFAVGFRIEHSQEFINNVFYGDKVNFSLTGPATYRLTANYKDKGIYSFCMCPGGYIVSGSSENNSLVLNGMSYKNRNNTYANSAIVTTVNNTDFGSDPLSGMRFQQLIEMKCFKLSRPYFAPSQKVSDFIKNNFPSSQSQTSYQPGTYLHDLNDIYPSSIIDPLKFGLSKFDRRIPGFCSNGFLLAPETRTSSPIRLLREKETFRANGLLNLFPIGEGSGYAGGIISSAVDGYKCCQQFIQI